jgi:hypothetical protein
MLELLQNEFVLDRRLLPKLKAWSLSSREAQSSMLKFFQETFMINDIRGRHSGQGGGDRGSMSLITARLFDCSDRARQERVEALVDDTSACSMFHAVYALHSAHVGIIAQMMATVQKLQPKKIALEVHCAQNHVCMQRGPSRCAVSTRPLPDVFACKLGSLQERLPSGQYYHALVISSNDDGLFAFAARCADSIMRSGAFGCMYQCWLPYSSSSAQCSWDTWQRRMGHPRRRVEPVAGAVGQLQRRGHSQPQPEAEDHPPVQAAHIHEPHVQRRRHGRVLPAH